MPSLANIHSRLLSAKPPVLLISTVVASTSSDPITATMVPTIAISTARFLVMPNRATTGYGINVCEANIDANSNDTVQLSPSRYTLAIVPIAIGIKNVSRPNPTPLLRLRFKWNISISRPAKNIKYSRPTCPNISKLLSRSSKLKP